MSVLDGNAMAGELSEVFAVDITTALFTCAGCGHADAVATLRLFGPAPGRVARCPHCDDVVLRIVRTPDRMCIDMRGALRLEVLLPDEPA